MRENHYAILVFDLKISYVFKLQDKHNASYFQKCLGWSCLYPIAKLAKILDTNK